MAELSGRTSFHGIPSWLATAGSIAVLYPAAMGTWVWLSAMVWGCPLPHSCGSSTQTIGTGWVVVNTFGEGWGETTLMLIGLVLGVFAMLVAVYSQFFRLGEWIKRSRFVGGRPVNEAIPMWAAAAFVAPPAFIGMAALQWGLSALWTDHYGMGSVFETVFAGCVIATVAILGILGVQNGSGWHWWGPGTAKVGSYTPRAVSPARGTKRAD